MSTQVDIRIVFKVRDWLWVDHCGVTLILEEGTVLEQFSNNAFGINTGRYAGKLVVISNEAWSHIYEFRQV